METKKGRGRPKGSKNILQEENKELISIRLDKDILNKLRNMGKWQPFVNGLLRQSLNLD